MAKSVRPSLSKSPATGMFACAGLPNCGVRAPPPESKQTAAELGQDFLRDLSARSPSVAANVRDAIRYELQAEEAAKFTHQKAFVITAYGVIWALLVLFVVVLWLRQHRLDRELHDLETRLGSPQKSAA